MGGGVVGGGVVGGGLLGGVDPPALSHFWLAAPLQVCSESRVALARTAFTRPMHLPLMPLISPAELAVHFWLGPPWQAQRAMGSPSLPCPL